MIQDFQILWIMWSTIEMLSMDHFAGCLVNTPGAPAVHKAENMHRLMTQQTPPGRTVTVIRGIHFKSISSGRYSCQSTKGAHLHVFHVTTIFHGYRCHNMVPNNEITPSLPSSNASNKFNYTLFLWIVWPGPNDIIRKFMNRCLSELSKACKASKTPFKNWSKPNIYMNELNGWLFPNIFHHEGAKIHLPCKKIMGYFCRTTPCHFMIWASVASPTLEPAMGL